jgi:hypothetical protein
MNVSTSLVHQHHLNLSIFHLQPNLQVLKLNLSDSIIQKYSVAVNMQVSV